MHLTVPAGFNPGPYNVVVTNPSGETNTFHNGFRACERRVLTCALQPLNGPRGRPLQPGPTTTWRPMLDGDDVFFPPEPRHEAFILLPELPSTLETRFEPGDGSAIQLELFPEADSGIVRLIGDDPAGLTQLWDEVRSAGGVGLPRIDLRSYGDLNLTVIPADIFPIDGQAEFGIHYSYQFTNGQLAEASAIGLGADLVLEVVGRDKYHCETVERISVLEAMGGGLP